MGLDPSAVWDFAAELVGSVRGGSRRTTATVTRVDADGTAWVTTGDGGEAPASSVAAGVSVGDTVTLEWDGSAMGIRSNVSNPSPAGSVIRRAVERAQGVASAAQRVADAVNQHFFADGHGIHVTEATQEQWEQSHTGPNVLINSIGQLFRDGLNNLLTLTTENGARALTVWDGLGNTSDHIRAIIGAVIQLGKAGESHAMLDYHSMQLVDRDSYTYFHVSDLRNEDGSITETFEGDGATTGFKVMAAVSSVVLVNVDDVSASYTLQGTTFVLSSAPASGATVEICYVPTNTWKSLVKAYTFGIRKAGRVGLMSVAEGYNNTASGEYSHVEGMYATTSGFRAHAEGRATTASGNDSHAEGDGTQASGSFSHAEGLNSKATDSCSHAEGYNSTASGGFSHAQNEGTVAAYDSQTAIGKYNANDPNNAFEIGNGTDADHRSNALTVDWQGNVECAGTISPTATASTITASSGASVTGDNACWTNGAATAFVLVFKCGSSLANNGTLTVGTLPEGYRPPYNLAVDVYTSAVAHVVGYVSTDGTVSIRNVGGSALATKTTLRVSSMWAVS